MAGFGRIEKILTIPAGEQVFSNAYRLKTDGQALEYKYRSVESDIDVYLIKNGIRESELIFEGDNPNKLYVQGVQGDSFSIEAVNNSASSISVAVYLLIQEF